MSKLTIKELEEMLDKPDGHYKIKMNPDGSITTTETSIQVCKKGHEYVAKSHEYPCTVCGKHLEEQALRELCYEKGLYVLKAEPFEWMKSWLNSYAKSNEIDVGKVMDWINQQPMTGG